MKREGKAIWKFLREEQLKGRGRKLEKVIRCATWASCLVPDLCRRGSTFFRCMHACQRMLATNFENSST